MNALDKAYTVQHEWEKHTLEVVERAGEAPFFVLRETFLCDPDGRFPEHLAKFSSLNQKYVQR